MAYPQSVWRQLKNTTADQLIRALKADGWEEGTTRRATRPFVKTGIDGNRRVVIHYHPKKTYGASILKHLLHDIGWSEEDLRRLKLIK